MQQCDIVAKRTEVYQNVKGLNAPFAHHRGQVGEEAPDIEVCSRCGGSVRVIACIEDQDVIDQILAHLRETEKEAPARPLLVPPTRAPPATLSLFAGTEFHQQGRH